MVEGILRMQPLLETFWPYILAGVSAVLIVAGTCHALMWKRDSRAAIGWVGLIWLAPILGSLAYFTLGINRIRRKATRLSFEPGTGGLQVDQDGLGALPQQRWHDGLTGLAELVGRVTGRPLSPNNSVETLVDGDEAYPAMLDAIRQARRSIGLVTYIFDSDRAGRAFVEALGEARNRGVEVRVLVDDVGARYSRPRITRLLDDASIPNASFLPTRVPRALEYANLRNHRKILIVDGETAFTGGANIREGHWLSLDPDDPVKSLHFCLRGPILEQMHDSFSRDWSFATGEVLSDPTWRVSGEAAGSICARGIEAGPDDNLGKMQDTLLGALGAARDTIDIVTPYFVPNASLIDALGIASMRGVNVRIVIPSRNNLPVVQWASTAQLWQVLQKGCRVWESAAPFDHTKLMTIDGIWSLIGSGNWDQRSLRLNFEFNVECYDTRLAATLRDHVSRTLEAASEVTLEAVDSRPVPIRLRDGLARLLAPYL
jgi:cardiolipin synthase